MNYMVVRLGVSAILTFGLYSILYRENKFYRLCEHIFLGLASGWALVALWTDTLKSAWWDKMVGSTTDSGQMLTRGYWLYALLLPIGLMGYMVFSRKHNWMSRIPIGIIIGLYSGQQFQAWQNRYIPQISDTIRPVVPTVWSLRPETTGLTPDQVATIHSNVYISDALTNLIFVFTVISVLAYFLFSFETKSKVISGLSLCGRWLLMIGFGAIFGSTVMMRFTLLIDRMSFVFQDFLMHSLVPTLTHR
ncbi:MAG TPA: hypothetical protein VG944_07050 [Fimbriimonas sp.]|nr:hypothetical protein [Fimbriimonas sp.]